MTIIINAQIDNGRLKIQFWDGSFEAGIPNDRIQDFEELIPLMIGSIVTERVLDEKARFFKLSFQNQKEKIHKFFSMSY